MPRIRFIRGTNFRPGDAVGEGDERDCSEGEARMFCDGYKDAVRIDGEPKPTRGMTANEVIEQRDPVAEHRDPQVRPAKRSR